MNQRKQTESYRTQSLVPIAENLDHHYQSHIDNVHIGFDHISTEDKPIHRAEWASGTGPTERPAPIEDVIDYSKLEIPVAAPESTPVAIEVKERQRHRADATLLQMAKRAITGLAK